jgi:hypothetical protein
VGLFRIGTWIGGPPFLTTRSRPVRFQAAGGIWAVILIVLTNVALRVVFLCFDYYAALALSTMGMNSVWAGGKLRGSRFAIQISSLHFSPRTERYHAMVAGKIFCRTYSMST